MSLPVPETGSNNTVRPGASDHGNTEGVINDRDIGWRETGGVDVISRAEKQGNFLCRIGRWGNNEIPDRGLCSHLQPFFQGQRCSNVSFAGQFFKLLLVLLEKKDIYCQLLP